MECLLCGVRLVVLTILVLPSAGVEHKLQLNMAMTIGVICTLG